MLLKKFFTLHTQFNPVSYLAILYSGKAVRNNSSPFAAAWPVQLHCKTVIATAGIYTCTP